MIKKLTFFKSKKTGEPISRLESGKIVLTKSNVHIGYPVFCKIEEKENYAIATHIPLHLFKIKVHEGKLWYHYQDELITEVGVYKVKEISKKVESFHINFIASDCIETIFFNEYYYENVLVHKEINRNPSDYIKKKAEEYVDKEIRKAIKEKEEIYEEAIKKYPFLKGILYIEKVLGTGSFLVDLRVFKRTIHPEEIDKFAKRLAKDKYFWTIHKKKPKTIKEAIELHKPFLLKIKKIEPPKIKDDRPIKENRFSGYWKEYFGGGFSTSVDDWGSDDHSGYSWKWGVMIGYKVLYKEDNVPPSDLLEKYKGQSRIPTSTTRGEYLHDLLKARNILYNRKIRLMHENSYFGHELSNLFYEKYRYSASIPHIFEVLSKEYPELKEFYG